MVLIMGLGLIGPHQAAGLDPIDPAKLGNLKEHLFGFKAIDISKLGGLKVLETGVVNLHVPLKIMDLPAQWRDADLVVDAFVIFVVGNQPGGICTGRKVKSQVLSNGSYQGTVTVPANELTGGTGNDYMAVAAALARKGDECMLLGLGCGGQGCGSADIGSYQGMVGPCGDNFIRDTLMSSGQIQHGSP